jgi:hypothetical protein
MTDILYTIDYITDNRNIPYVDNMNTHKQPICDIINHLIVDNNSKRVQAKQAKIMERDQAKQAKIMERDQAKQAKIMERDQAKRAKIMERDQAKQAKINKRDQAKQAKIMEREQAKQDKIMEREQAKQDKIMERVQAKQAKIMERVQAKQAKIMERVQAKQAKIMEREQAKQDKTAQRARDKLIKKERLKRTRLIRKRYIIQNRRTDYLFSKHRKAEQQLQLLQQRRLHRQRQRQREIRQQVQRQQQQLQLQRQQLHNTPPPIVQAQLHQPERPRRSHRIRQQPLNATTNIQLQPLALFNDINPDILTAMMETSTSTSDFARRMTLLENSGILQPAVNPNQEAINRDRNGATKTNILELVSSQHAFKQDECPVCFDNIGETNQTILRCGHQLCTDCIFHNIQTIGGTKCPVCREQICVRVNGWMPPQRT